MKLNESLREAEFFFGSKSHLEHSFNQIGDLESMCEYWAITIISQ